MKIRGRFIKTTTYELKITTNGTIRILKCNNEQEAINWVMCMKKALEKSGVDFIEQIDMETEEG